LARIYPLVLTAIVVIVAVLFAAADAAPGDDIYLRPGQLVSADGATLNLYCTGGGSPAVVLDAGHQDWAPA